MVHFFDMQAPPQDANTPEAQQEGQEVEGTVEIQLDISTTTHSEDVAMVRAQGEFSCVIRYNLMT